MPTSKKTTYSSVRSNFQNKMNYYKVLWGQTSSVAGSKHRPTPTQLNTFSKWIDKGASIQNISPTMLNRWAGKQRDWTVTAAKQQLTSKYGKNCIKAVAWNKSGGCIVATSSMRGGKTFKIR